MTSVEPRKPAGAPWVASIRALVGVPYVFASTEPAAGLDCMSCASLVYRMIGEGLGDPEAWRFPFPIRYGPDGRIELDHLLDYYRHWEPARAELGATWPQRARTTLWQ